MDYIGLKCPICGKPFTADDDIVVCPQCGAPYHRECYISAGKCIYEDKHGTGFSWKPPQEEEKAEPDIKRCPRCGAPNLKSALFCSHCGLPLSDSAEPPYGTPFNGNQQTHGNGSAQHGGTPPEYGNFQGQPFPFPLDPLGGVNPNEPINDVPAGDLAKFVQGNTQYYMPVFASISHFKKNRFNFSAFFFQGIWMLYRKLYKVGTIITVIQGALTIGYLFLMKYFVLPLYDKLYAVAGLTKDSTSYAMTAEQKTELVRQLYSLPTQQKMLVAVPFFFFVAALAIMLICGFVGNRMYLKYSVSQVGKIRSETSSPTDFAIRLQQNGGVNTTLGVTLGLCFMIIFFVS